jgi:hypothetical protein
MIKQLALVASFLAAPAQAETAWLVKSQDAGYVMQRHWQTFVCSVFSDRVEIVRAFGPSGLSTKEVRPVELSGDVAQEIRLAAGEALTDSGTLCDAPGTRITAHLPGEDGLLLYGRSTCSQDGEREGEHSTPLIALANGLCGEMR